MCNKSNLLRDLTWFKKSKKPPPHIEKLAKPHQHILVTGGTGFIGRPLCQALIDQGHYVTIITRYRDKAVGLSLAGASFVESFNELKQHDCFDIIINLAGAPVSQRWSRESQVEIMNSRIETTKELIAFIKLTDHKPSLLISGSAIGIYGTDEEKIFTEETPPSQDAVGAFPRELCERWEALAKEAESLGIRTCLLRTGIVLEKDGGALAKMLVPFKLGLGGQIGSGKQWFSWIHRDDLVRLIVHLINNKNISGAVNATAPHPVSNKTFSRALGKAVRRPAMLPLPAFQVKLLFGKMGETLLLAGQKVLPQKALTSGFNFSYPTIDDALQHIFKR